MLNSYRKGAFALAAAFSFVAGAAQAEQHTVLIVEGGYFPSVVYVQAGDSVTFENESGATHTIVGEEDVWTSGEINLDGSFTVDMTEEVPLMFSGNGADGLETLGEFSYDEPPLADG